MTLKKAKQRIAKAGCRAVVIGRRATIAIPPGRVLGQSVAPGRRVRRGTVIRLLLSRAQAPVRPPFTG